MAVPSLRALRMRAGAGLLVAGLSAPAILAGPEAAPGFVDRARIGAVAVLPFVARGAGPEAWPRLRGALRKAMTRRKVTLVRDDQVAAELQRRRLRDTSILSHEEMLELAEALRAQKLLLGYIYRLSGEGEPVVTFSGRLIDPRAQRIEAMTFTATEARELQGALGSGGEITLEQTLDAATREFVDTLIDSAKRTRRSRRPPLLDSSALAPEPAIFVSEKLDGSRLGSIVVLPFRNRTPQPGAGQAAADLASWSLNTTGSVTLIESGDATRRLLERGWRTGMAMGTEEILALGLNPGVDSVLMGTVDRWKEGDARGDRPPELSLSARLLDARTGAILWAADHERRGDQTRVIYDVGNVRLAETLLARATHEMLRPLHKIIKKAARKGGKGDTK